MSLGKAGIYGFFCLSRGMAFVVARPSVMPATTHFLSIRAAVVHKDIPIRVMHRMTPRIAKRWGFSLWIEMGIVDQKSSSTIGRWPAAVRFCIATPYLWISCEGKFRRKFSPMSFPQLAPRLAIAGTRVSRKDDGVKLRGRAR